ncbi:hypothetical protein C8J56DRAFT_1042110 [Mycena floridula]|nr:hypothetical protein C8J56DRAFT_1042110 [Mycena floridula]
MDQNTFSWPAQMQNFGLPGPEQAFQTPHPSNRMAVISTATEKELFDSSNVTFLRLELALSKSQTDNQCAMQEISELKREITGLNADIVDKRAALAATQSILETFMAAKASSDNNISSMSGFSAPPPPIPPPLSQSDYPKIAYWTEKSYLNSLKAAKGDTDANATGKKKRGRPPKASSSDEDTASRHIYLQHSDGSFLEDDELSHIGNKARRIFQFFQSVDRAPDSWGNIDDDGYDYYWAKMATDFKVFQYADGSWKLDTWTKKGYPSWARNHLTSRRDVSSSPEVKRRRTSSPKPPKLDEESLLTMDELVTPNESLASLSPESSVTPAEIPATPSPSFSSIPVIPDEPMVPLVPLSTTFSFYDPLDDINALMQEPHTPSVVLAATTAPVNLPIPVAASKSVLRKPPAIAAPGPGMTEKNFCMRDWVSRNPGGLKTEFENYYASLNADTRQVFANKAKTAHNAAQKQKRATKKAASASENIPAVPEAGPSGTIG